MEEKLALTAELQSLKKLGDRGHSRLQDEELINALKDEVRYSALYIHTADS